MNKGGFLTQCDCPCECAVDSYTRWCAQCQVEHYRKIAAQIRSEQENENTD